MRQEEKAILKAILAQLPPGVRGTRAGVHKWTRVLVPPFACIVLIAMVWTLLSHSAYRVDAQEPPLPASGPTSVREHVEAWRTVIEQRASLPAWVSDFHDVLALTSFSTPSTDAPSQVAISTEVLTLTQRVYLPVVRSYVPRLPPRLLGDVTLTSGPTPCEGDEERNCYEVQVECPQLAEPLSATLKVGEPVGSPTGTIVFASGWDGKYYWGEWGNYAQIIGELEEAGYRTVQMRWHDNWWAGARGGLEGHARLACRPASLLRWVHDNLHGSTEMPFCAEGHSNGASAVAYALTQYGLMDIFSAVLLEGGPNYARIDYGCIQETSTPDLGALFYGAAERGNINRSLGLSQGSGACVDQDSSYLDHFEEASLAYDWGWEYRYPGSMLAFVFGEDDLSTTAVHGAYYYNRVKRSGTPFLSMEVVTDTPHFVGETAQGMMAIRDTLIDSCAVH